MSELVPFGHDGAWLAVRDRTQADVVEALGLADARVVDPATVAEIGAATVVLPPLPGVGGRWTLAVGSDPGAVSATRLRSLSAILGSEVQVFADGGGLRSDHGRTVETVATADRPALLALAATWSLDPTTLSGPAPGQALLVEDVAEGPPPPEPLPPARRRWWLWSPPGVR